MEEIVEPVDLGDEVNLHEQYVDKKKRNTTLNLSSQREDELRSRSWLDQIRSAANTTLPIQQVSQLSKRGSNLERSSNSNKR